jgi:hypothetical protein
MIKVKKYILMVAILFTSLFLSATKVYADLASPGFLVVGGIVLIGAGIFVVGIGLIAWRVICMIRKRTKKNIINRKDDVINK